jgi:hypothetical protein
MEHEYQRAIPLSIMIIWVKAKILLDEPNSINPDPNLPMFAACAGWF